MNGFEVVTINAQEVDGLINTVNGRDLHGELEIGKVFAAWMPDMISKFGFEEGVDFVYYEGLSVPKSESSKSRSQKTKEYALTLDMAKEVAMVQRNHKGREVRKKFIEAEKQLREIKQGSTDISGVIVTLQSIVEANASLVETNSKLVELLSQGNTPYQYKTQAKQDTAVCQDLFDNKNHPFRDLSSDGIDYYSPSQIANMITNATDKYVKGHQVNTALVQMGMQKPHGKRQGYIAVEEFSHFAQVVGPTVRWSKRFLEIHGDALIAEL